MSDERSFIASTAPKAAAGSCPPRSCSASGALGRIGDADGFASLGDARRSGLWEMKALRDAPLPLFAAAHAREGKLRPEAAEPRVALAPMVDGKEVVEDYRATTMSLRAQPKRDIHDPHPGLGLPRSSAGRPPRSSPWRAPAQSRRWRVQDRSRRGRSPQPRAERDARLPRRAAAEARAAMLRGAAFKARASAKSSDVRNDGRGRD